MTSDSHKRRHVAVVGAGITGLSAAHRLGELDQNLDITLIEGASRLGGVLQTILGGGFLAESSADSFVTDPPWAVELCRRIGFEPQLVPTEARYRRVWIVHRGRLYPAPRGFVLMSPTRIWPLLTTPILSWRGKLRLLAEYFVPPAPVRDDESLKSFVVRRLGREAFDRLVQPLVSGIYTADPAQLSLASTLPRFLDQEQKHGGLIRAARHQAPKDSPAEAGLSGARYELFVAPRAGLSSLVDAIAARLKPHTIRLATTVTAASSTDRDWQLQLQSSIGETSTLPCDALILAPAAPRAADLLGGAHPKMASMLREIKYASATVVLLGYRRAQIAHSLDGFGFVVPTSEGRQILAASFSSVKFPGRAPPDWVLVRVFLRYPDHVSDVEHADAGPAQIAHHELRALLGIEGEAIFRQVVRWNNVMPQYRVGHAQLVEQIEQCARSIPGLALAGNAYRGVGIPQCVHSGELAAEAVLRYLNSAGS